jgi:hypothetical protein
MAVCSQENTVSWRLAVRWARMVREPLARLIFSILGLRFDRIADSPHLPTCLTATARADS